MKACCGGAVWALVLGLVICQGQAGAAMGVTERHSQTRVLYVLAIGIGDYAEVADLPGTAAEAQAVAAILKNGAAAVYDVVEVVEMVDQQATKAAILRAVNQASVLLKAEDTFVFYFSGHGQPREHSQDGESYLAPHDAALSDEKSPKATNLVSAADLRTALGGMQAKRRLLLFDSMHFDVRIGIEGTHVIQATGPGGMVLATSEGGNFTNALLQALQGWGDADQDGRVSVFELAGFVGRHLPALDPSPQIPAIRLYGPDFPLLSKDFRRAPSLADKLDANLVDLIQVYEAQGIEGIQVYSAEHQIDVPDGQVQVTINAISSGALDRLKDEVVHLGGTVETEFENILYATLPVGALEDFVMQESVWRVDWSRQVFAPPSDATPSEVTR